MKLIGRISDNVGYAIMVIFFVSALFMFGHNGQSYDPNAMHYPDTLSLIMTRKLASDSIAAINTRMGGKALSATTLSINGTTQDLSANRTWTLTTSNVTEGSGLYYTDARARAANSAGSGVSYVSGVITNTSPDQTVGLTAGTGISVSGTYPNFTVTNSSPSSTPTFNASPSRSLSTTGSNNTFTISSTKNARVKYTINFAFALTLSTSNGYVELDYSTDAGSTWNIVSSVSSVYSLSVTLSGNSDNVLSGEIPSGALVRLYRINATNVTITAPTTKQQEVTY